MHEIKTANGLTVACWGIHWPELWSDKFAGANKGIIDDPIVLTIYATGAPDLTLIDLPGITRVPVKGSDQREDIEKLTKDMTIRYVKD